MVHRTYNHPVSSYEIQRMHEIRKQILSDEHQRPIAVQVSYVDWLVIERELKRRSRSKQALDLSRYAGTIRLREDPLAYQQRTRDEWA